MLLSLAMFATVFENYLETKTKEKVIKFDGVQLVTNKGVYGLAMKELNFRKNK